MIEPRNVSAVLVTRGDVDMTPVLESLPFDDIVVWNNSEREDYACYGRFAAIEEAKNDLIYLQDDDALCPVAGLLRTYNPAEPGVFANKPASESWRFLGLGALFDRSLVDGIFDDYIDLYGFDHDFCRVADIVFAYQHPYSSVDYGYAELQWSRYENRMYRRYDHMFVRERARSRTLALPTLLADAA